MSTKAASKEDIPDIEEDEHDQQNTEHRHLITHHNTHKESERIRREYTQKLQDLDDQLYFQQVDENPELIYYLPQAPYDEPQVGATRTTHPTAPQRTT